MHKYLFELWRFIHAVWLRMADAHFGLIAAGVAFYAMFAVFPGLTATVAIWSLVADPAAIASYLAVAERFLPTDAALLVHDQVVGLMETPRGRLGWATVFSLSVAFYSARAGVAALIQGMDFVHRTQPRGLVWGWAVDFILTGALIVALIVALGTVVVMPVMLAYVGSDSFDALFLKGLPWAAMFLLVLTCLGILYRYGPNYGPDFRGALTPWVTPGTFFAALAWAAVSIAFSAYLANFNSYNRIYGSIGAVIALLMWLYLSVWTVLMGAAINAELSQRHRKKKGGNLPPDPDKI